MSSNFDEAHGVNEVQTALDLWRDARAAAPTLADADAVMSAVESALGTAYERVGHDTPEARELVVAWDRVQSLRHQLGEHEAVAGAAGAAIEVADAQRVAVVNELDSIMRALRDEGEHEAVSNFSDMVVEEEFEMLLESSSIEATS